MKDKFRKKRRILKVWQEGETFGVRSFLTGTDKVMNVMSNQFSELIKINSRTFMDSIKDNKQDYEKFMNIRDKIVFDNKLKLAKIIHCYICKSQEHTFNECSNI